MATPPSPGPFEHNILRRPVPGGVAGGNALLGNQSTLGMVVFDTSGWPYLIHNAHANTNWNPSALGAPVSQPRASIPGGTPEEVVAQIVSTSPAPTTVDSDGVWVGISDLTLSRFLRREDASPEILGLGTPSGRWRDPTTLNVGERVWKSGRRTGVTTGTIRALNQTVDSVEDPFVRYRDRPLRYTGAITLQNDLEQWLFYSGDSGAVYFDRNMDLVGVSLGAGILTGEDRTNPDNVINTMQPTTWLQKFLLPSGYEFPQLVVVPPDDVPPVDTAPSQLTAGVLIAAVIGVLVLLGNVKGES